jgi:hypothetical protein
VIVVGIVGLVAICLVAVGAVVLLINRADDDPGGERAARAELVTAPRDLIAAVHDERYMATNTLLGLDAVVQTRLDDNAAARRQTDTALADFEAALAGAGATPYRGALAAFDDLDGLRREIDGRAGPGSLEDLPYAQQIQGRYAEMIAALLDANRRVVATTVRDRALYVGASLFEEGLRQTELVWQLTGELLDQAGWNTAEGVSRLSELHGEMLSGRSFTTTFAADTEYARAADQLEVDLDAAGTVQALDQLLRSGQGDTIELLASTGLARQAWLRFLDSVEARLVRGGA